MWDVHVSRDRDGWVAEFQIPFSQLRFTPGPTTFVEGSGNFNFDFDNGNLFYSRRIGRSPQGAADLPGGADVYVDSPPQTRIPGAGKVTGRVGKFSIGVLHAVTRQEHAAVVDGGVVNDQPVESRCAPCRRCRSSPECGSAPLSPTRNG